MSHAAYGDSLALEVGASYWHASFSGDVITQVDLDSELSVDRDGALTAYAELQHPLPFIPNFRLARTNLKESGQGNLLNATAFEGTAFLAGQLVASEIDLSHTDATLYYEILDQGLEFDVGLTLRFMDGEFSLDGVEESADLTLPMLFARGQINLPFTGTYVSGQANVTSYSGDRVTDTQLGIGWRTENFIFPEVGIETGYRQFSADVDDSVRFDVEASGAYLNAMVRF